MKKLKLNGFKLVLLFLLLNGSIVAQSLGNLTLSWELIQEKDGVQFYAKYAECMMAGQNEKPFDIAFLKIVNNNSSEIKVNYNFVTEYLEGCNGCNSTEETTFRQSIPANSAIEDDCNFTQQGMAHIVRNQNFKGGWNFKRASITSIKLD